MNVFDFDDYKLLVRSALGEFPKQGHGQLSRIAERLGVAPTLISQIVSGEKDFTEDQACAVAEHLGFNTKEIYYFVLLVQHSRAGHSLRKVLSKQILEFKKDSVQLKGHFTAAQEMSYSQQAAFYSDWVFSAVHALSSIPGCDSAKSFHTKLGAPLNRIVSAVDFLLQTGLCVKRDGKIEVGPNSTFVPSDSPLAIRHHQNWRQKALEVMDQGSEDDFFYTGSMTISEVDFIAVRRELVKLIKGVSTKIEKTTPQKLACLNIDLFDCARNR